VYELCHFSFQRLEGKWHNWYSTTLFLYKTSAFGKALTRLPQSYSSTWVKRAARVGRGWDVCCGFDSRRDSSVTCVCLMYVNKGGASTRAHSRIGWGVS